MSASGGHGALLIEVFDDVLSRPREYRTWALTQPFSTFDIAGELWNGIALVSDDTVPSLVRERIPGVRSHLTFVRRSPLGQAEPNFIHSDETMGDWTAILYLNPSPEAGDGTTFWRFRPAGDVHGSAQEIWRQHRDRECWEP